MKFLRESLIWKEFKIYFKVNLISLPVAPLAVWSGNFVFVFDIFFNQPLKIKVRQDKRLQKSTSMIIGAYVVHLNSLFGIQESRFQVSVCAQMITGTKIYSNFRGGGLAFLLTIYLFINLFIIKLFIVKYYCDKTSVRLGCEQWIERCT